MRSPLARARLVVVLGHLAGAASMPLAAQPLQAQAGSQAAEADRLATARRYPEAAAAYAAALAAQADLDIARRALGSFWRAGRFVEAYQWGRRLEAAAPRDLRVLFNLGVTCGYLIEHACVREMFTRVLEVDPAYVYGHGELAFLAQAQGDMTAAVQHMRRAVAAAPSDEFAVSGLAQMLIPSGGAAEALRLTTAMLATRPDARAYGGRSMRTLRAWALAELGQRADARATAQEVLARLATREQQGETSYELFRERAALRLILGEREAAIADLQSAARRGWRLYGAWDLVDPMFAAVRTDPAIRPLMAELRADVVAARRAVGLEAK